MPLSMENKLPTMIDCPIEYNFLEANTKYYLVWESSDGHVVLAIDPFDIEEDPNKGSRYTGDCFRPKSPMEVKLIPKLSGFEILFEATLSFLRFNSQDDATK